MNGRRAMMYGMIVTMAVAGAGGAVSSAQAQEGELIPSWIKQVFIYYANDQISEAELINALTYLLENDIIRIDRPGTSSNAVPSSADDDALTDAIRSADDDAIKAVLVKIATRAAEALTSADATYDAARAAISAAGATDDAAKAAANAVADIAHDSGSRVIQNAADAAYISTGDIAKMQAASAADARFKAAVSAAAAADVIAKTATETAVDGDYNAQAIGASAGADAASAWADAARAGADAASAWADAARARTTTLDGASNTFNAFNGTTQVVDAYAKAADAYAKAADAFGGTYTAYTRAADAWADTALAFTRAADAWADTARGGG